MKVGDKVTLTPQKIIKALKDEFGVGVENYKVVQSGTEPTFVPELTRPLTNKELYKLSELLEQEAIAAHTGSKGMLAGPKAASWGGKFNPDFYLNQEGRTFSELADVWSQGITGGTSYTHFSRVAGLKELEPRFGEGVAAGEAKRKAAYPEYWVDRINVYTKQVPDEARITDLPHKYTGTIEGKLLDSGGTEYTALRKEAVALIEKDRLIPTPEAVTTLTEKLAKERGFTGIEYPKGTIVFGKLPVGPRTPIAGSKALRMQEAQLENIDKIAYDFLEKSFTELRELPRELSKEAKGLIDNLVERVEAANVRSKEYLKDIKGARAEFGEEMAVHPERGEAISTYVRGFRNEVFTSQTVNGRVISGQGIRDVLKEEFDPHLNKWLQWVYKGTRASVTMKATLDDSAPFTFGWYLLGSDIKNLMMMQPSAAWLTATGISLEELFSTRLLGWYRGRNLELYTKYLPYGLKVAEESNDYFAGLGFIRNAIDRSTPVTKHPQIGDIAHAVEQKALSPVVRANRAFSAFSEVGRIELLKAHENTWLALGGSKIGLIEFVDLCTSTLPRFNVATNQNRIYLAGTLAFAPNYLWSNLLLIGRMLKPHGGITGRELKKIYTSSWAGWTAIYLALWYGTEQEGDPHIFPWDPEFFTFKVDGRTIGLPGFNIALTRTMSTILYDAIENPDKLFSLDDKTGRDLINNWMNVLSPGFRFIAYKESPPMEILREIITGRDVLNKRVDTPLDILKDAGLAFLPISIENIITEDRPQTPVSAASIFFGWREYPDSASKLLVAEADEYLKTMDPSLLDDELWAKQQDGTLTWYDLGPLRSVILAENPRLAELQAAADAERLQYKEDVYLAWNKDNEGIDTIDRQWYVDAATNLRDGTWTMRDYNDSRTNHIIDLRGRREQLESTYADLYKSFDQAKTDNEDITANFSRAYNEYYDTVYGEDTVTNTGDVIWEARELALNNWKQKWGDTYWNMLQTVIRSGFAGEDPLFGFMYELDNQLNEYWQVPKENRDAFRENPANIMIEAALIFRGKTSSIKNPQAEEIVRAWCDEYGLDPNTAIPAFVALMIPDDMVQKYNIPDPNALREYSQLPSSGYDRKRYILEHPEFAEYMFSEVDTATGETRLKRYDVNGNEIYSWDRVPTIDEENLMAPYMELEDSTSRKVWRCRNQAGEQALIKFGHLGKVIYGTEECQLLIGSPTSGVIGERGEFTP
jgi:hypothetical protein